MLCNINTARVRGPEGYQSSLGKLSLRESLPKSPCPGSSPNTILNATETYLKVVKAPRKNAKFLALLTWAFYSAPCTKVPPSSFYVEKDDKNVLSVKNQLGVLMCNLPRTSCANPTLFSILPMLMLLYPLRCPPVEILSVILHATLPSQASGHHGSFPLISLRESSQSSTSEQKRKISKIPTQNPFYCWPIGRFNM